MKSSIFTTIRFILALLTVLAIVGKPYIPSKTLLIHPATNTIPSIYGPTVPGEGSRYSWVDQKESEWWCDHRINNDSCGFSLSWDGCAPEQGYPNCASAETDPDGDGWGWENEQSCIVVKAKSKQKMRGKSVQNEPANCTSASTDPDGDGWGWENGASCKVVSVAEPVIPQVVKQDELTPPPCSSTAVDPDGDGWGWENDRSCQVTSATDKVTETNTETDTKTNTSTATASAEVVTATQTPVCSPTALDPDGDGWSWENNQSCQVKSAENAAAVAGTPVCRSTEADPDGDGWGWENDQSCQVVEPLVKSPDMDANSTSVEQTPECTTQASDPDGDGWGWENERSCKVGSNTQPATVDDAANRVPMSACNKTGSDAQTDESSIADNSIDFSKYDGINVKIHYEGRAKYLRLFLRNSDPKQRKRNADGSFDEAVTPGKFMSVYLRTEDLKAGTAYVSLSEFSVAEWWILGANAPRNLARTEFDHIVSVGVDHIDYGVHKMRVERVELVGDRVTTENFLLAIFFFWGVILLLEAWIRYYYMTSASRAQEAQINELTTHAQKLEQEKSILKTRSVTDSLTGAYNRAGVEQQMLAWHNRESLANSFGILMFDIDHFKIINDSHGHDVGDHILKSMTDIIEEHIREGDIFARWGGEEFVLIARQSGKEDLIKLAEKLRLLIAEHLFEPPLNLKVTVSIGVTTANKGEVFATGLKRADIALYQAKVHRNCIAYED